MRALLLALAAFLKLQGAGSLSFVDWTTTQQVEPPRNALTFTNKENCTVAVCNDTLCVQANNVLADAGQPTSTTRLITCPIRVGQGLRNWAADAGITVGPAKYQTLRFVGLRARGWDGGFAMGIPMDDNGLPQFSSLTATTLPCVRAPVSGGTGCKRSTRDGGFAYFGAGNVFPSSESNGHASCEPVNCSVMYGDNPDTDL